MNTLFIGSTKRGFLTLNALIEMGASVTGIMSLEQMPSETERFESKFRELAAKTKIPLFETKNLKDRNYVEIISKELRPDLIIVVGCRVLLPQEIIQIPRLGTIAVHDSLLPAYRGFAPLNWAIINGEKQTGVSLFYLSDAMDAGDLLSQVTIPISEQEFAGETYEKVCAATVRVIVETYPSLQSGSAERMRQNHSLATYTCSRTPEDGQIFWADSTRIVFNLIRGISTPFPGAYTFFAGRKMIIWKAVKIENAPTYVGRIPGRVIQLSATEGWVDVLTGDGILRLLEVQMDGEENCRPADLIKSVRLKLG